MPHLLDSQLGASASGEDVPALLIIGNDAAHRSEVIARLHALSAATDTTADTGTSPKLKLDNKYYTASIALVDVAPETAARHPAVATAEGVILLFSRHDASSFDTLTHAVQSADANVEVQLCVCDAAMQSGGGRPSPMSAGDAAQPAVCTVAQQWAAQELYEYIEVDSADAAADAALQLDGEPQGMRRVLAAIEAHMWSGLHLKPPPSECGSGGGGNRSGGSPAVTDAAGDVGHSAGQPPAAGQSLALSTPSNAADGAAGCSGTMNGGADVHIAEPGRDAGAHEAFGSFLDPDLADGGDRSFAQLMGQMAGVRERLRDLPDSERRAGAEQMALQMMQLLGIDDSDDETADSADPAPPDGGQHTR